MFVTEIEGSLTKSELTNRVQGGGAKLIPLAVFQRNALKQMIFNNMDAELTGNVQW